MRKMALILVLAAMATFTQCKKQENNGTNEQCNGVQMVLKADNGSSKTSFGANGSITWNANEKIYVVTNGECVGYVTNGAEGGNTFTGVLGRITQSGTYDFHYYYLGNTKTITPGDTSFTMDFSDQDGTLANLGDFHVGYGLQVGVEVIEDETVNAQATMTTLVAMAYFNTATMAETGEEVFLYGDNINNQLSVDFSTNVPVYGKVNDGWICAGTASSGVYVMLLPNHTDGTEELDTDITFVCKKTFGTCNNVFKYGIVGGRFYCNEGNTDSPIPVTIIATGIVPGTFSVSATKKVYFSQGNLQYIGSAGNGDNNNTGAYWKFAEGQQDYIGPQSQNNTEKTIDRDLFSWGTSGYNHGATVYQPWAYNSNTGYYYAYGNYNYNLYDETGQADWGYNAISNGGNTENSGWRTLNKDEWDYVFNGRTDAASKWGYGKVNDVKGMILLPDEWTLSNGLDFISSNSDWTNVYSVAQWAQLEANGAVFLPAAGYCNSGTNYLGVGSYWSSSNAGNYHAYVLEFGNNLYPQTTTYRSNRVSVRLVRDAE